MANPEKVRARIQFVDQTLACLRAERGRLVPRASVAARKRNMRRKILVGLAAVAFERLMGFDQEVAR